MRTLLELLLISALVIVAWEKPYHEWLGEAVPIFAKQPAHSDVGKVRRALPASQPSPALTNGAWMHDPNRKTALDRPAYNNSQSFTSHVVYKDESGKNYWIDGEGKRHYE